MYLKIIESKEAKAQIKDTLCQSCHNCDGDRLRIENGIETILNYGCGNYGFNRSFNKGFKPRKKRCKHYDENY